MGGHSHGKVMDSGEHLSLLQFPALPFISEGTQGLKWRKCPPLGQRKDSRKQIL